jgi:predicted metalloprotease with PDZ domain
MPQLFRRVSLFAWLISLTLWPTLVATQTPSVLNQVDIRYQVAPIIQRGELKSLRITLSFKGQSNGQTIVYLPNDYAGQTQLWRQIGTPNVRGGRLTTPQPNRWAISHKPNARIVITYDLKTAFDAEPDLTATMSKPFRPIIRPDWFSLVGSTSFVRLSVNDQTPIGFRWRNVPKGWQVASDLEHEGLDAGGLMASSLIGGRDLKLLRLGRGGTRIAMRGSFSGFTADQREADFTKLNAAQRALWGDNDRVFFISLAPVKDNSGASFQLGTGLGDDAFATWVLESTTRSELIWLFAHEHLHAWVPGQIGGLDNSISPISSYWLSEGFTNYYTARTLVRARLWTPEDWIKHWNEVMGAYQTSPARLMSARETVDKFWSDRTIGELPYQRGALLALTIDQRIKQATNQSKSLDDVMRLMRSKARAGRKFAPDLLIESVKEIAGLDVTSLINDIAINGQALGFPNEGWGECINLQESVRPVFDVGFDRDRTGFAGNIVAGVRQNGPAYQAGLRDGMKILRRTTGKLGDPTIAVTYEIEGPNNKIETLSWLPRGPSINIQTLALGMNLSPEAVSDRRASCLAMLGGE